MALGQATHALYDLAAAEYHRKWLRRQSLTATTPAVICSYVADAFEKSISVLDLCSGTGRATGVIFECGRENETNFVCGCITWHAKGLEQRLNGLGSPALS